MAEDGDTASTSAAGVTGGSTFSTEQLALIDQIVDTRMAAVSAAPVASGASPSTTPSTSSYPDPGSLPPDFHT